MLPSIFGENLFDDFFNDPFCNDDAAGAAILFTESMLRT